MSLEAFLYILSAPLVLLNKFGRTSKYFTPTLSFAILSTYASWNCQNILLSFSNASILLNLRLAEGVFEQESFEGKNCFTIDTGRLPASTKTANIDKQHHLVCATLETSDVQTLQWTQFLTSLAAAFWFTTRVADYQQHQIEQSKKNGKSAFLQRSFRPKIDSISSVCATIQN